MESANDVTKARAEYGHKDGVHQLKEDKELLLILHFLSLTSMRRHTDSKKNGLKDVKGFSL